MTILEKSDGTHSAPVRGQNQQGQALNPFPFALILSHFSHPGPYADQEMRCAMNYIRNNNNPLRTPRGSVDVVDARIAKAGIKSICIDGSTKNLGELKRLTTVTSVTVFGKLDQVIADALAGLPRLTELRIVGLREIPAGLKLKSVVFVGIHNCPGVQSFDFLAGCKGVQSLYVSACLKLRTLSGLEKLRAIKELQMIGGPLSTGKVDSLSPLGSLRAMEYLSLFIKVGDKSLVPIKSMRNLEEFETANRFKHEEYESVLAACPKLATIQLHNGAYTRQSGFKKDRD